MIETKPLKHDNCKDCIRSCEHAGKDREFCYKDVSCKKVEEKKVNEKIRKEIAKEILDEVFKEVERVRLETEFKDETGKWLIDEHEFFTEFTIGALYELSKKYGV